MSLMCLSHQQKKVNFPISCFHAVFGNIEALHGPRRFLYIAQCSRHQNRKKKQVLDCIERVYFYYYSVLRCKAWGAINLITIIVSFDVVSCVSWPLLNVLSHQKSTKNIVCKAHLKLRNCPFIFSLNLSPQKNYIFPCLEQQKKSFETVRVISNGLGRFIFIKFFFCGQKKSVAIRATERSPLVIIVIIWSN